MPFLFTDDTWPAAQSAINTALGTALDLSAASANAIVQQGTQQDFILGNALSMYANLLWLRSIIAGYDAADPRAEIVRAAINALASGWPDEMAVVE